MAEKKYRHPILSRAELWGKNFYNAYPETITEDREAFWNMLIRDMSGCNRCILAETRNKVVMPDGKFGASIMVVSDNPGFVEDLSGIPLSGSQEIKSSTCNNCLNVFSCYDQRIKFSMYEKSRAKKRAITCKPRLIEDDMINKDIYLYTVGNILDGILVTKYGGLYPRQNWIDYHEKRTGEKYHGVSPWYITNGVMCRSWNKEENKDVPPDNYPLSMCKHWLALQWAVLEPKVIVALGQKALGTVIGSHNKAVTIPPGEVIQHPKLGPIVFNSNPARIMRDDSPERSAQKYAELGKSLDIALEIAGIRHNALSRV